MKVIYQGIPKADQERFVEEHLAVAIPPEKRGEEKKYEIDRDDPETVKERKREARKRWFAAKRKDLETSVAKDDASRVIYGIKFDKGVATEVPADNDLLYVEKDPKTHKPTGKPTKLQALVDAGVFLVAEKADKAERKPQG